MRKRSTHAKVPHLPALAARLTGHRIQQANTRPDPGPRTGHSAPIPDLIQTPLTLGDTSDLAYSPYDVDIPTLRLRFITIDE
jgi:hypothetical protein